MPKICLDVGHGFKTAGKRTPLFENGQIIHEAEQNYPIMFKVAEYLKYNNVSVVMTNTDIQNDMKLRNRCKKANIEKADIFISIHKNALSYKWQSKAKGIETYVYKKGYEAEKLAKNIQKQLILDTGMTDRKIKQSNFYVLRKTKMPAVLLELGFMDYRREADQMKNLKWHEIYAKAITKGVCNYFSIEAKFPDTPAPIQKHWAEEYYNYLISQGIKINEKRFDDKMTRGEVFALCTKILKAKA